MHEVIALVFEIHVESLLYLENHNTPEELQPQWKPSTLKCVFSIRVQALTGFCLCNITWNNMNAHLSGSCFQVNSWYFGNHYCFYNNHTLALILPINVYMIFFSLWRKRWICCKSTTWNKLTDFVEATQCLVSHKAPYWSHCPMEETIPVTFRNQNLFSSKVLFTSSFFSN